MALVSSESNDINALAHQVASDIGLTPEVREAVDATIAALRWLNETALDAIVNYRGGTDEKVDVPRPTRPEGTLASYAILRYLALTSSDQSGTQGL